MIRENFFEHTNIRRVVIKVGTSLITDSTAEDGISAVMIAKLRDEIRYLRERGIATALVSSGSVGAGRHILRNFGRSLQPDPNITRRQALAALGQSRLVSRYAEAFAGDGIPVAQLLITARDFRDRRAYLNVGRTFHELLDIGALAVVNENDTISTDELQFGDNDLLSAIVASLFDADLLILLTSVEGFLVDGRRIPEIDRLDANLRHQAGGPAGPGRGGMSTKLRAGELCSMSGGALAILPGDHEHPVRAFFEREDIGTFVKIPRPKPLSARKQWLLFARAEGGVTVDAGAARALAERGKSLLPVGIRAVRGRFLAGEVIEITDESGRLIGRGIANYSYRETQSMLTLSAAEIRERGLAPRADEVIHRDNLILEDT